MLEDLTHCGQHHSVGLPYKRKSEEKQEDGVSKRETWRVCFSVPLTVTVIDQLPSALATEISL